MTLSIEQALRFLSNALRDKIPRRGPDGNIKVDDLIRPDGNRRRAYGDTYGDIGAAFPGTDAEDMGKGARFIPYEVTVARRAGEKVKLVTKCNPNCWYWEMPDGSHIYHYDSTTYYLIGIANGRKELEVKNGDYGAHFEDGAGPCPHCGNPNTNGGTIKP